MLPINHDDDDDEEDDYIYWFRSIDYLFFVHPYVKKS